MAIIEPELDLTSSCSQLKLDEYLKFGYCWETHDKNWPQRDKFLGISIHSNKNSREAFKNNLYSNYIKKFGSNIPDTYYLATKQFEIIVDKKFDYFISNQSLGRQVDGIFILKPTIRHINKFNLFQTNTKLIEDLVQKHCSIYPNKLITLEGLLKEIAEDTRLWYSEQN